jgi:hypothetical protein
MNPNISLPTVRSPGTGRVRVAGRDSAAKRFAGSWSSRLALCAAMFAGFALSGCAQFYYQNTKTGKLDGILRVEWIGENNFIYAPDENAPLKFISSDGNIIMPQKMYTDGGSIPPVFWGVPGLSPWGYAPGYVIHDWVFQMHHCKYPGFEAISFKDSGRILSETIRTLMDQKKVPSNPDALFAIYEGVSSSIAEDIWNNGQCRPVTAAAIAARPMMAAPGAPASKPIVVLELDFRPK